MLKLQLSDCALGPYRSKMQKPNSSLELLFSNGSISSISTSYRICYSYINYLFPVTLNRRKAREEINTEM